MTAADEPVRFPLSKGSTREDCNRPGKNAQDAKAKSLNFLFQLGQSDAQDVIIHAPARNLGVLPWIGEQLDACFVLFFISNRGSFGGIVPQWPNTRPPVRSLPASKANFGISSRSHPRSEAGAFLWLLPRCRASSRCKPNVLNKARNANPLFQGSSQLSAISIPCRAMIFCSVRARFSRTHSSIRFIF